MKTSNFLKYKRPHQVVGVLYDVHKKMFYDPFDDEFTTDQPAPDPITQLNKFLKEDRLKLNNCIIVKMN